ncbi:CCA tRNA nucleotidyltransferase [Tumebacillus algifaecis]|uniref:CCA tRNA nucleotidyltransferase n=1 Tax=Tumebacillus algifaecis TaxID=1214604 RepID=UPI0012FE6FBF|nr:CCA tRNA nucleotidyltransferase [Tumebacillus algifaecis]
MDRTEAVAWQVVEALEQAGHEAYLVGGCVRDKLLQRPIYDYDITTSARPEEVLALFPHTLPIGMKHGTVTVCEADLQFEVTTFRTDGEYKDGRRPSEVVFVRSLLDDLARRDLTINALALGRDGTLHDPFDGQLDLLEKRIRAVGDPLLRFEEDALRMLRAIRFAVQLQFVIEEETLQAIREESYRLRQISRERIREEWHKMLLSHPDTALDLLRQTDTLRSIFSRPTLAVARWERAAAWTALSPPDLALRYCLIFFAIETDEPRMEKNLQGLKLSTALKREIREQYALQAESPVDWNDLRWRQLLFTHGYGAIWRKCLLYAVMHDAQRLDYWTALAEEHRKRQPIWGTSDLALTGLDLIACGIEEGPHVGQWLKRLAQAVLQDPSSNDSQTLLQLVQSGQVVE